MLRLPMSCFCPTTGREVRGAEGEEVEVCFPQPSHSRATRLSKIQRSSPLWKYDHTTFSRVHCQKSDQHVARVKGLLEQASRYALASRDIVDLDKLVVPWSLPNKELLVSPVEVEPEPDVRTGRLAAVEATASRTVSELVSDTPIMEVRDDTRLDGQVSPGHGRCQRI